MKSNQSTLGFPVEYGLLLGVALGLSGQFPTAVLACIAWFGLRRVRPNLGPLLLLVTSIYAASFVLSLLALASGLMVPFGVAEMVAVTVVALMLFLTAAPRWAYFLIAHSIFTIILRSINLHGGMFSDAQHRLVLGVIVLKVLIVWMLVLHLRRAQPPPSQPEPSPHEEA